MAWSASNAILILGAFSVLTPFVTYAIAVHEGHVEPFLPYISSTGDSPPESTVFTQLIVITAAFLLLVVHIRFVHISLYCKKKGVGSPYPRLNVVAIWAGYTMCAGLLVLACFQLSNAFVIHNTAWAIFTGGCFLYTLLQTIISWRLKIYTHSKVATIVRVVINVLIIISISTYVTGLILCKWKCSMVQDGQSSWCREPPGRRYHIVGAVSEWLLLVWYSAYVFTFYNEFRMVKLTTNKITIVFHDPEESPRVST